MTEEIRTSKNLKQKSFRISAMVVAGAAKWAHMGITGNNLVAKFVRE